MKKLVCIVLSIILLLVTITGCSISDSKEVANLDKDKVQNLVQSNSKFSFEIFKQLNKEDRDKNVFISPLSISTALSMTYQGAKDITKDAMAEALSYRDIDIELLNKGYSNLLPYLNQDDNSVQLSINNSIWFRKGLKVEDEFLKVNKDVFDSKVADLDFSSKESVNIINKWVNNSTEGKIEKIIEEPIPADVVMYLINAIYFNGEWLEKFDESQTFDEDFNSGNGETEKVNMMSRTGNIEYGSGDDFKTVRLPYGDGNTSMYCVLPSSETSINDFINSMDFDKWEEIKSSISEQNNLRLQIPRFKLEYGIKDLKKSLSNLGMENAFTDSANFTGIGDDLFISKVLHKAIIEVNEKGSEAAAVTSVEIAKTSMPASDPISFIADRPFLFIITDDESETILFMGKLYDIK